jgi:hypothetical protein
MPGACDRGNPQRPEEPFRRGSGTAAPECRAWVDRLTAVHHQVHGVLHLRAVQIQIRQALQHRQPKQRGALIRNIGSSSRPNAPRQILAHRRFFLRRGGNGGCGISSVKQQHSAQSLLRVNQENSDRDRFDAPTALARNSRRSRRRNAPYWLNGGARSPREAMEKQRLRDLLGA